MTNEDETTRTVTASAQNLKRGGAIGGFGLGVRSILAVADNADELRGRGAFGLRGDPSRAESVTVRHRLVGSARLPVSVAIHVAPPPRPRL